MKRALTGLFVAMALLAPAGASAAGDPGLSVGHGRYVPGELVEIKLTNDGTSPVTMGDTWRIERADGDGSTFYQWPEEELEIAPGDERVWRWDQLINNCYGVCQNVRAGDPAPAGRYDVSLSVDGYEHHTSFRLGQYFTIGFEGRPQAKFVVFVTSQPEVDQMTAEAAAEDKTLIVSGIVRGRKEYNLDWGFSMGSNSIELGEVFIEVCDGSPYYVDRHRKEWKGERWCPWSSYVERVGR